VDLSSVYQKFHVGDNDTCEIAESANGQGTAALKIMEDVHLHILPLRL
jgi:hypothetical protein